MASQSKLPFAAAATKPVEAADGSATLPPMASATRPTVSPTKPATPHAAAPIWLQRLSLAVLVVFCVYLGGLLVYLPWWKEMWDHNGLLLAFPRVHHWLIQGPVRGLVSGIGLLDLWIGVSEIVHYREYRG